MEICFFCCVWYIVTNVTWIPTGQHPHDDSICLGHICPSCQDVQSFFIPGHWRKSRQTRCISGRKKHICQQLSATDRVIHVSGKHECPENNQPAVLAACGAYFGTNGSFTGKKWLSADKRRRILMNCSFNANPFGVLIKQAENSHICVAAAKSSNLHFFRFSFINFRNLSALCLDDWQAIIVILFPWQLMATQNATISAISSASFPDPST